MTDREEIERLAAKVGAQVSMDDEGRIETVQWQGKTFGGGAASSLICFAERARQAAHVTTVNQSLSTPAPWKFHSRHSPTPTGGLVSFVVTDARGKSIAACASNSSRDPHEIAANARLIAAAPQTALERDGLSKANDELIATLKQIAAMLDQPVQYTNSVDRAAVQILRGDARAAREVALATVAKMEGR
jgi:hypothetical protein